MQQVPLKCLMSINFKMEVVDLRRSESKQKLEIAFFKLLENHHYSKISVTDLIEEAGCSRTTFYRHYTDVLDMYDKVCFEIISKIVGDLSEGYYSGNTSLTDVFDDFCLKLESQKDYIVLLCGKNGGRKFFEVGLEFCMEFFQDTNPFLSSNEAFALRFIVLSGIASYVKALLDGTEFDRKYLDMYKKILSDAEKEGARNG